MYQGVRFLKDIVQRDVVIVEDSNIITRSLKQFPPPKPWHASIIKWSCYSMHLNKSTIFRLEKDSTPKSIRWLSKQFQLRTPTQSQDH
jgi:hypothetical protein